MIDLIKQLKEDLEYSQEGHLICLTISTTSGNESNYLTPIRMVNGVVIMGCVVHSTKFCLKLVNEVFKLVDVFFIDVEKKLPPTNMHGEIDTRNILHPIKNIIKNSAKIIPYKPNDITVNSIYDQVIDKCLDLRDCTVGIIGFGNIGAKISLKLVECGIDICVLPRKISYKEQNIVNSINSIKHDGAIASVTLTNNIYKCLLKSDIVLCCATSENILDNSTIPYLQNKKLILDVGKRNISKEVYNSIKQSYYCDVTDHIVDYVLTKLDDLLPQKIESPEYISADKSLYKVGTLLSSPGIFYKNIKGKINFLGEITNEGLFRRLNYKEIITLREKYVL